MTSSRLDAIMGMIAHRDFVPAEELVEALQVSSGTVRRDLIQLEERGLVRRVRGGVMPLAAPDASDGLGSNLRDSEKASQAYASNEFSLPYSFAETLRRDSEAKAQVARSAAALVADGDTVFLDAGTTTYGMLDYFAQKRVTVVTLGIPHLLKCTEHKISAYVLEGFTDTDRGTFVLTDASLQTLSNLTFSKAFLGTYGVDFSFGYTTTSIKDSSVKQMVLGNAAETYVLGDSSKYGTRSLSRFARPEDVVFIGDEIPDEMKGKPFVREVDHV